MPESSIGWIEARLSRVALFGAVAVEGLLLALVLLLTDWEDPRAALPEAIAPREDASNVEADHDVRGFALRLQP